MRVLHVPYSYFPDPAGGTEIYVDALASWQRSLGCDAAVAAPAATKAKYDHSGTPVWRFPVSSNLNLRDLYGEGDKISAEAFGHILDEFGPDVVHLHAMTSAVSVRLAEEAAARGIAIVLNYHTPTVSCSRGTLLKWGTEICDGRLEQHACASCTLQGRGLPRPLANLVASLPVSVCTKLGQAGLSGGSWTALRMPELIDVRIRMFHRMVQLADRIIALCNWTRELLIRNRIPEDKIMLCRQGISWNSTSRDLTVRSSRLPLRAAFLGRFDATKGAHIVVQALRNNPDLPVELDLFGVSQGIAGERYAGELQSSIVGERRIRVLPPIPPAEVVPRLGEYDLVVVPSQWLETGPLVVLEAFAAGTAVVGSDLGGIAELVTDGVDGLLVKPAASASAWAEALQRVCRKPDFLDSLRAGIRPPRHTRQAAAEIMPLYSNIIGDRGFTRGAPTNTRPEAERVTQ